MTERIEALKAELAALETPAPVVVFAPVPGDLVRLRALNGPVMVVVSKLLRETRPVKVDGQYETAPDIMKCGWFDKNHVYCTADMPVAALQAATG